MAEDATEQEEPFDPFSAAEAASEQIIELILAEGGKLLYERYIEKKSFSFAAEVVSQSLVNELKLCFVRFDRGEPGATRTGATAGAGVPSRGSARLSTSSSLQLPAPCEPSSSSAAAAAAAPVAIGGARQADPATEVGGQEGPQQPREAWTLEQEPPRCRVDTWARACVPIRRKLVQPKRSSHQEDTGGRRVRNRSLGKGPGSSASHGRAPSRSGIMAPMLSTAEGEGNAAKGPPSKAQQIPLTDEREEDDEEAEMRDRKDREARRRREEEARIQLKAAAEAEEVAIMAQVKDQMKNKPFTYDSQGNIIWIQPPNLQKLPAANPAPGYACKKEGTMPTATGTGQHQHETSPRPAPKGSAGATQKVHKRKKSGEFQDSFRRFASQQPSMMEVMKLSPGVGLSQRGHNRNGAREVPRAGQPMTRKDYEAMAASGVRDPRAMRQEGAEGGAPSRAESAKDGGSVRGQDDELSPEPAAPSASASAAAADLNELVSRGEASHLANGSPGMKVVRGADLGGNLVPHAPTMPRPVQPVPPPTFRRVQMKRDALGYSMSSRERVPTGTGSRFPGCAAQPPLGATMGHGLATGLQRPEEFYYPGANAFVLGEDSVQEPEGVGEASSESPAGAGRSSAVPGSPKGPQGQIVSKDPALVRRLFR